MASIEYRQDPLATLGMQHPLRERMDRLYDNLHERHPIVHRLAVALLDSQSMRLHTFIYSGDTESPLKLYETKLEDAPELARLAHSGKTRVIQDLDIYANGTRTHTIALRNAGFRASYTLPFFWNNRFEGFVFFNSREKEAFTETVLPDLDLYAHLAGSIIMNELNTVRTLMSALRASVRMVHTKDPETGGHLERMASYARLISQRLAKKGKYSFDEDFIEHLTAFAPMHDIGKLGIPDAVLMKQGPLNEAEFDVMKHHPDIGRQLVDGILRDFGLEGLEYVELLKQVAEGHHEMLDGSGYPHGNKGSDVPIASRIIAVADIFDALTSHRPYKEPWSNQDAFGYLVRQSEHRLDQDCVEALMEDLHEVERIQKAFRDC